MNEQCNVLAAVAVLTGFLDGCATAPHSDSASASTSETAQVRELAVGMTDVNVEGLVFLDLDRNRAFKSPWSVHFAELEGLEVTPVLSDWLQENGIDLLVQLAPHVRMAGSTTTATGAHLRGVNLRGVAVLDGETWRLSKEDSSGKSWPRLDPKCDVYSSRMLGRGADVYHALLRTQEGRVFALEEQERLPDGISIRYEGVVTRR